MWRRTSWLWSNAYTECVIGGVNVRLNAVIICRGLLVLLRCSANGCKRERWTSVVVSSTSHVWRGTISREAQYRFHGYYRLSTMHTRCTAVQLPMNHRVIPKWIYNPFTSIITKNFIQKADYSCFPLCFLVMFIGFHGPRTQCTRLEGNKSAPLVNNSGVF